MRIIKLDTHEGNAFYIMGTVQKILQKIHGNQKGTEVYAMYRAEATNGDYEHLKETSLRYCNGVNSAPRLIFVHSSDVVEVVNPKVLENNEWWKTRQDKDLKTLKEKLELGEKT